MGIWDGRVLEFQYLTYRNVEELRRVVPMDLVFEESPYYPMHGKEWFLRAWCLDRQAERRFMMSRIMLIDKAEDQSLPWRKE